MKSSAPASGQDLKNRPRATRGQRLREVLIIIFATVHAVKLLAGIIPERSRPDPIPFGMGHAYETLTGSRQHWNMFETIPSFHAYDARIVIVGTEGKQRQLGPILPRFQSYPNPEETRLFNLFFRMMDGEMGGEVIKSYLQKVDRSLRAEGHLNPGESWWLEVDEDYTRLLASIRKDGKIFERKTRRFSLQAQTAPATQP